MKSNLLNNVRGNMERLFLPFHLSEKMRVLGFNETCLGAWFKRKNEHTWLFRYKLISNSYIDHMQSRFKHSNVAAPTYEQAIKYLIVNHKVNIHIFDAAFYAKLSSNLEKRDKQYTDHLNTKLEEYLSKLLVEMHQKDKFPKGTNLQTLVS